MRITQIKLRKAKNGLKPQLIYVLENGRSKTVLLNCSNRDAAEIVNRKRLDLKSGKFMLSDYVATVKAVSSETTLKSFINSYLGKRHQMVDSGRLSQRTFQTDVRSLKELYLFFGDQPLSGVLGNAKGFVEYLCSSKSRNDAGRRFSNVTINLMIRHIHAAFNTVRDELNMPVTFRRYLLKDKSEKPVRAFSESDQIAILTAVNDKGFIAWKRQLIVLGLNSGLRRGEIFTLMRENISEETVGDESTVIVKVTGKSGDREVPLNDEAEAVIRERLEILGNKRLAESEVYRSQRNLNPEQIARIWKRYRQGYLFYLVLSIDTISHCISDLKKSLGIKGSGKSLHGLRHTFAIEVLRETGDLKVVKDLLGHSSLVTTEIYAKSVRETQVTAVKKIRFGKKKPDDNARR